MLMTCMSNIMLVRSMHRRLLGVVVSELMRRCAAGSLHSKGFAGHGDRTRIGERGLQRQQQTEHHHQ